MLEAVLSRKETGFYEKFSKTQKNLARANWDLLGRDPISSPKFFHMEPTSFRQNLGISFEIVGTLSI